MDEHDFTHPRVDRRSQRVRLRQTLEEIVTAPVATAQHLAQHHPAAKCLLLNSDDIAEDLAGITLVEDDPDVVVLGGAGA